MVKIFQDFQDVIGSFVVPLVIAIGVVLLLLTLSYVIITLIHIARRRRLREIRRQWKKTISASTSETLQPSTTQGQNSSGEYRDALVTELMEADLSPKRRLKLYRNSGYYDKDVLELSSKKWWKRSQSLNRLKSFPLSHLKEKCVSLIYDSSHDVRLLALDSISCLEEFPKLDSIKLFNSFPEKLDPFVIIKLLAMEPGEAFIRPLINAEEVRFRRAGATLLGQPNKLNFLPFLRKLTDDDAVSVRNRAVESLGKVGGTESLPVLRHSSTDKIPSVREAVARSLKEIREKDSLRILGNLAEDSEFRVRLAAFQALTYFGEEGRQIIGDHWGADNELAREAKFESYQR